MYFKRFLSGLLALVIAIPPTWATTHRATPATAQTHASALAAPVRAFTAAERKEFVDNLSVAYWRTLEDKEPLLAEFLKKPDTDEHGHVVDITWQVSRKSTLLDNDPFFLRAQKWVSVNEPSEAFAFRKLASGGVQLQIPGALQALQIDAPLTPLLETSEYILLAADSDDFFAEKLGGGSPDDQGVFFLNKKDYVSQSLALERVHSQTDSQADSRAGAHAMMTSGALPVFFYPLPGRWAGVQTGFEWLMRQQIALYDQEGFAFLLDVQDFRKLEELSVMNLRLTQGLTLLAEGPGFNGALYPPARSTAFFGLFVSGLMPSEYAHAGAAPKNLVARFAQIALPQAAAEESFFGRLKRKAKDVGVSLALTAGHVGAVGFALTQMDMSGLIPPDMVSRMLTAGSVIAASYVGAVVLKNTVYKQEMLAKYPPDPNASRLQKVWQGLKSHLDIFPYNTNLIEYAPMQTVFQSTRLAIDRLTPKNKFLHTLYENTFGWTNRSRSSIPVTWRPTLLGLVEGHAASLTVAASLLLFYPWLYQHMGWQLAAGTSTLAAHFVSSEIIRVYFDYWRGGGHIYTTAKRISLLPEASDEADRTLEARGLDPLARSSRKMRQDLTEDILNTKMTADGMPDRKDFKFDFNSLFGGLFDFFGTNPEALRANSPLLDEHHFIFEDGRWGLMRPAINEALKRARDVYAVNPTDRGAKVIAALDWAHGQMSYLRSAATETAKTFNERRAAHAADPVAYNLKMARDFVAQVSRGALEKGRDIRKVLWLASTSGDTREAFQFLPPSWLAAAGGDKDAAKLAAELLHYSLHGLNDKRHDVLKPTIEQKKEFHEQANDELRGLYPDSFERQLRFEQRVSDLVEEKAEQARVNNYNPTDFGRVERAQYNKGVAAVEDRLDTYASPQDMQFDFAQAVAKKMGLYVESRESSTLVQKAAKAARQETEARLETPIEVNFLNKIEGQERAFYEAWVYTQEFLKSYVTLANSSGEVEYGSPERPGGLQKLRRAIAKAPGYNRFFKPCIAAFETLFKNDIDAYQTGLKGVYQRLPLVPEMVENLVRATRSYPYAITAGYLINITFFQSTLSWPQAIFFSALYPIALFSVSFTNRLMDNLGLNPMRDLNSRLIYTYVLSWLVSARYIPMLSWGNKFDVYIRENFASTAQVAQDCIRSLVQ